MISQNHCEYIYFKISIYIDSMDNELKCKTQRDGEESGVLHGCRSIWILRESEDLLSKLNHHVFIYMGGSPWLVAATLFLGAG